MENHEWCKNQEISRMLRDYAGVCKEIIPELIRLSERIKYSRNQNDTEIIINRISHLSCSINKQVALLNEINKNKD